MTHTHTLFLCYKQTLCMVKIRTCVNRFHISLFRVVMPLWPSHKMPRTFMWPLVRGHLSETSPAQPHSSQPRPRRDTWVAMTLCNPFSEAWCSSTRTLMWPPIHSQSFVLHSHSRLIDHFQYDNIVKDLVSEKPLSLINKPTHIDMSSNSISSDFFYIP